MDHLPGTISSRARVLRSAASLLEVVAILASISGALAGAIIAGHVRTTAGSTGLKTHPQLAAGIAVIIAAVLLGVLAWCIARAIGLFAIDVAARQGVDLTDRTESTLPEFLRR